MDRALILSGGGARGAFQVGVLKYLDEKGWRPDMICGASVGAVNAVAIGSGMTPDQLVALWVHFDRRKIYHFSLARHLRSFFATSAYHALMDTSPLKALLQDHIKIDQLRHSDIEIRINAVHLPTSRLTYFTQHEIDIDHIIAASALPLFFPWQSIKGEPYWDGGMIENTPIAPAYAKGAKQIIAVLLTPVGNIHLTPPCTPLQVLEFAFEQLLQGAFQSLMINQRFQSESDMFKGAPGRHHGSHAIMDGSCRVTAVSPARMLGFKSFLNFTTKQAKHLMAHGYRQAQKQLEGCLESL